MTTATRGTFSIDEKELEAIDPAKKLEMQKVREMLAKKAAELQLLRYEEELRKLQDESDRLRIERASERIRGRNERRHHHGFGGRGRYFSEGSLSDSDLSQTGRGLDDYDTRDYSRILGFGLGLGGTTSVSMQSLPTLELAGYGSDIDSSSRTMYKGTRHERPTSPRKLFLSKSEEDIIREIEKQISESTGRDYKAYDRNEIERQVRARYGDYDSDGSSTASSHSRTSDQPLELPDYRLRSVRQKLKEELRQVTADKKAALDSTALSSSAALDSTALTSSGIELSSLRRSADNATAKVQSYLYDQQSSPLSASNQTIISPPTRLQTSQNAASSPTATAQAQSKPRKSRHRHQGPTDSVPPMFSPIKEHVDIEAEVARRMKEMDRQKAALDKQYGLLSATTMLTATNGSRRRRKDTPAAVATSTIMVRPV